MKKAIAILLVLLVAGAAFGAYTPASNPSDATLTIVAANNGVLEQKITAGQVTDGAAWTSNTPITASQTVLLSSTDSQNIAYYSMRTNTKKSVDVTVSATAMENGTDYYIPFTLSVGTSTDNFGSFLAGTTAPTVTPSIALITDGSYTGMTYFSEQIAIQFAADYSQTALEGDYTSTITFNIEAN